MIFVTKNATHMILGGKTLNLNTRVLSLDWSRISPQWFKLIIMTRFSPQWFKLHIMISFSPQWFKLYTMKAFVSLLPVSIIEGPSIRF